MNDLPTRQKILLGVLVIVVGYYVWDTFLSGPSTPQRQASRPAASQPARQNRTQPPAQQTNRSRQQTAPGRTEERPVAITTVLEWKNDPFYREKKAVVVVDTAKAPGRLDDLKFTGFMHSGNAWIVTINGSWYEKDEYVDGMKITNANEKYVVLEENGTAYKLHYSR